MVYFLFANVRIFLFLTVYTVYKQEATTYLQFCNVDNENYRNLFCCQMSLLLLVEASKHTQEPKLDFKLSLFQHCKLCVFSTFPGKFGRDPGDTEHHRDQPTSAHCSGGLPQPAHGEQGGEDLQRHCHVELLHV